MESTDLFVHKRSGYITTSTRGLDFSSVPMRLFQKSKRLGVWDPFSIDLTRDRKDWNGLSEMRRENLLGLSTLFQAGEEAVTLDLLPLVMRIAQSGRIEEEIYLTAFLWEEAKHTEFFRRWLTEVPGVDYDLHHHMGPNYRRMFLEQLPQTMGLLLVDGSRSALARALVTYNMIVEGVLAETGYWSYTRQLEKDSYMPGLAHALRLISRDEARHIRFGVYLLQVLINEDPGIWDVIEARMQELFPIAIAIATDDNRDDFESKYGPGSFIVSPDEAQAYAATQFERRMRVLQRARTQSRSDLEREIAAELDIEPGETERKLSGR